MKKRICKYCIEAMKGHGIKVYVGEIITQDLVQNDDGEFYSEIGEEMQKCEHCEEVDDTLYECEVE